MITKEEIIKSRIESIKKDGPQDGLSLRQLFIDIIQIEEEALALSLLEELKDILLGINNYLHMEFIQEARKSPEILSAAIDTKNSAILSWCISDYRVYLNGLDAASKYEPLQAHLLNSVDLGVADDFALTKRLLKLGWSEDIQTYGTRVYNNKTLGQLLVKTMTVASVTLLTDVTEYIDGFERAYLYDGKVVFENDEIFAAARDHNFYQGIEYLIRKDSRIGLNYEPLQAYLLASVDLSKADDFALTIQLLKFGLPQHRQVYSNATLCALLIKTMTLASAPLLTEVTGYIKKINNYYSFKENVVLGNDEIFTAACTHNFHQGVEEMLGRRWSWNYDPLQPYLLQNINDVALIKRLIKLAERKPIFTIPTLKAFLLQAVKNENADLLNDLTAFINAANNTNGLKEARLCADILLATADKPYFLERIKFLAKYFKGYFNESDLVPFRKYLMGLLADTTTDHTKLIADIIDIAIANEVLLFDEITLRQIISAAIPKETMVLLEKASSYIGKFRQLNKTNIFIGDEFITQALAADSDSSISFLIREHGNDLAIKNHPGLNTYLKKLTIDEAFGNVAVLLQAATKSKVAVFNSNSTGDFLMSAALNTGKASDSIDNIIGYLNAVTDDNPDVITKLAVFSSQRTMDPVLLIMAQTKKLWQRLLWLLRCLGDIGENQDTVGYAEVLAEAAACNQETIVYKLVQFNASLDKLRADSRPITEEISSLISKTEMERQVFDILKSIKPDNHEQSLTRLNDLFSQGISANCNHWSGMRPLAILMQLKIDPSEQETFRPIISKFIALLISKGANIKAASDSNRSPALVAINNRNWFILQQLYYYSELSEEDRSQIAKEITESIERQRFWVDSDFAKYFPSFVSDGQMSFFRNSDPSFSIIPAHNPVISNHESSVNSDPSSPSIRSSSATSSSDYVEKPTYFQDQNDFSSREILLDIIQSILKKNPLNPIESYLQKTKLPEFFKPRYVPHLATFYQDLLNRFAKYPEICLIIAACLMRESKIPTMETLQNQIATQCKSEATRVRANISWLMKDLPSNYINQFLFLMEPCEKLNHKAVVTILEKLLPVITNGNSQNSTLSSSSSSKGHNSTSRH